MQAASSTDYHPHFQSALDEIKWLHTDADLGFTSVQHRLGVLYLESASGSDDLYQAYKWLFISVALGNETARDELIEVNRRLDYEEIEEAYQLAEDWFDEKFDDDFDRDECNWSPELMKWRFALPLVH
jgi:TPR repeat protein